MLGGLLVIALNLVLNTRPPYVVILKYDRIAHWDPFAPITEEDLIQNEYYAFVYTTANQELIGWPCCAPVSNPPYVPGSENWVYEVTWYEGFYASHHTWNPATGRESVDMITALKSSEPYQYFPDEKSHVFTTSQGDSFTFSN